MSSPHQKRHLSQVFLKTTEPCEKLASVLSQNGVQSAIEVGPGKGILTRVLLDHGLKVTSVEKDARFAEFIKEKFAKDLSDSKLNILNEDILEFNFDAWREEAEGTLAICGNIPYNISTPLLERMLPQLKHMKIAALLVQLEFAERLVSPPGMKSYGSLSVFAQLQADLRLECKVDRSLFTPVPKVDSAIISFRPKIHEESQDTLRKVEKLTKLAFSQRRKKLSNSISVLLEGMDKSLINIDFSRRPDTLTPLEYLELTKFFVDHPFFNPPKPRKNK